MKYTFATQEIGLSSIINARDLGGYVLPDGRRIKKGLLLRGGATGKASDEDLEQLHSRFHLSKIFDFRTSIETAHVPDRMVEGAQYIWMPAFDEKSQAMEGMSLPSEAYKDLENWLAINACRPEVQTIASQMYEAMTGNEFTQMQYAGFLQNIVSTEEGAVYWHCSQGKDRTGLGSALILAALGADRELIINDYSISAEFYETDIQRAWARVSTPEEREVMTTFISANAPLFSAALDHLERDYGSLMGFLTDCLLLSDSDISILRARYLE